MSNRSTIDISIKMQLFYIVLATCAALTVAVPASKPNTAIASPAPLLGKGVELIPFAKNLKRQTLPDFYMDTGDWFYLADKRDWERKERERKAREQKEQESREQTRREQQRIEQERQRNKLGSNPFLDTVAFPDDYISITDLQDFQDLE